MIAVAVDSPLTDLTASSNVSDRSGFLESASVWSVAGAGPCPAGPVIKISSTSLAFNKKPRTIYISVFRCRTSQGGVPLSGTLHGNSSYE